MTHSFPTRRSSDLVKCPSAGPVLRYPCREHESRSIGSIAEAAAYQGLPSPGPSDCAPRPPARRSEEHTSALQSLMRTSYAVFCLKKKNTQQHIQITHTLHQVTITPTLIHPN